MAYAGDLTPQQAWDLLTADEKAVLVDVRTTAEWSYVGIPDLAHLGREAALVEWVTFPGGARNPQFLDQVRAAAGEDATVVFLCRSGVRSVAAAEAATAVGMVAYNVLEGFEGNLDADRHRGAGGWKSAGLPWRQS